MALYNQIPVNLKCPRCGREAEMMVDLYFGFRDQLRYKLGDSCRWTGSPLVKNGGRPQGGNLDGEGYTECPLCKRDFFVIVKVRSDVFEGAEADQSKNPFIED